MRVTSPPPPRLRVACVLRVHGVRGEVRVESLGGDIERFAPGTRLQVEGQNRAVSVRSARAGNETGSRQFRHLASVARCQSGEKVGFEAVAHVVHRTIGE